MGRRAGPAETLEEQLASGASWVPYRIGFAFAAMLAPATIAIVALLVAAGGWQAARVRERIGLLLLPVYAGIATIAYTSQLVVLPALVESHPETAAPWYLHDASSIPYRVDLVGYGVLGVAAVAFATAWFRRQGVWRSISVALLTMAALSGAALVAMVAGAEEAAGTLSIASGAAAAGFAVLSLVVGSRLRRHHAAGVHRPPLADVG